MKAIPKGVLKSKVFGVKYHTCEIIRVGSGASDTPACQREGASVYIHVHSISDYMYFLSGSIFQKRGRGWGVVVRVITSILYIDMSHIVTETRIPALAICELLSA